MSFCALTVSLMKTSNPSGGISPSTFMVKVIVSPSTTSDLSNVIPTVGFSADGSLTVILTVAGLESSVPSLAI